MNRMVISFILTALIGSCSNISSVDHIERTCQYKLDTILKQYPKNEYERIEYKAPKMTEILDIGDNVVARGLYKFDENDILRFYAFIEDSINGYNFSVEYDSLGNEISRTGQEVVRWYMRNLQNDTLNATFLFYSVNQQYSNIEIAYEDWKATNIEVVKSRAFLNLAGNTIGIPFPKNSDTIRISGKRQNTCTDEEISFEDFVVIPKELLPSTTSK